MDAQTAATAMTPAMTRACQTDAWTVGTVMKTGEETIVLETVVTAWTDKTTDMATGTEAIATKDNHTTTVTAVDVITTRDHTDRSSVGTLETVETREDQQAQTDSPNSTKGINKTTILAPPAENDGTAEGDGIAATEGTAGSDGIAEVVNRAVTEGTIVTAVVGQTSAQEMDPTTGEMMTAGIQTARVTTTAGILTVEVQAGTASKERPAAPSTQPA